MQLGKNVIFIQVKLIVLQPGHDMCCVTVGRCMFVSEGMSTHQSISLVLFVYIIYKMLNWQILCFNYGFVRKKES